MTQAQNLVSLDCHIGCALKNHGIEASWHVIVGFAGDVALVVAKVSLERLNFNGRQGGWARTKVDNADGQLGSGNKLLNDGHVAVDISIDHRAR